jgi:hypothetical protein
MFGGFAALTGGFDLDDVFTGRQRGER